MFEGGVDVRGETDALVDECGLCGVPGGNGGWRRGWQRRSEEMDADAGVGGVEDDAGRGVGMVSDAGAGSHGDVGIAGAGHDDGNSVGEEQGAQVLSQGERDGFFVESWRELCAEVGAAMGRVEDDGEARGGIEG